MKSLIKKITSGFVVPGLLALTGCDSNPRYNSHSRTKHIIHKKVLPLCYIPQTNQVNQKQMNTPLLENDDDSWFYLFYLNPASPISPLYSDSFVGGFSQSYSDISSSYDSDSFYSSQPSDSSYIDVDVEVNTSDFSSQSDPGTVDYDSSNNDSSDFGGADSSSDSSVDSSFDSSSSDFGGFDSGGGDSGGSD
jgi:uncharacterized membrane protein YgcG